MKKLIVMLVAALAAGAVLAGPFARETDYKALPRIEKIEAAVQVENLDVTISEDLTVTGDLTVGGDFTVTDAIVAVDVTATDDVIVGDDLTVTGSVSAADVTAADLTATDDVVVGDDLTVTGSVSIAENLVVGGAITGASSRVSGTASVGTTMTAADVVATNSVDCQSLVVDVSISVPANSLDDSDIAYDSGIVTTSITNGQAITMDRTMLSLTGPVGAAITNTITAVANANNVGRPYYIFNDSTNCPIVLDVSSHFSKDTAITLDDMYDGVFVTPYDNGHLLIMPRNTP